MLLHELHLVRDLKNATVVSVLLETLLVGNLGFSFCLFFLFENLEVKDLFLKRLYLFLLFFFLLGF